MRSPQSAMKAGMIKAGMPKQREISPYEMIAPSEPQTFWKTLLVFSTSPGRRSVTKLWSAAPVLK